MKNLLVAVDFSQSTDPVLAESAKLATALGAKLWILHVTSDETQALVFEATQFSGYAPEAVAMPGDVQLARDINAEEIKREHSQLQEISSRLRKEGINAQALLLKGDPAKMIVDKAAELQVAMIILGSHGHGLLHKALIGSVSESIIRHAGNNVLIVPAAKNSTKIG